MITADIKNTQRQIERRQAAIKSAQHVFSLPSGSKERWQAAFDHFIRQRPDALAEAKYVAAAVAENRKLMDKFGATKHGRHIMSTPSWLIEVLKNSDPEYFISKDAKDLIGGKHLRKMKAAFPAFFYPEIV